MERSAIVGIPNAAPAAILHGSPRSGRGGNGPPLPPPFFKLRGLGNGGRADKEIRNNDKCWVPPFASARAILKPAGYRGGKSWSSMEKDGNRRIHDIHNIIVAWVSSCNRVVHRNIILGLT